MANDYRQVLAEKVSSSVVRSADAARWLERLTTGAFPYLVRDGVFPKRGYPLQWHGEVLADRLNLESRVPALKTPLLPSIRVLQQIAAEDRKNRDVSAIDRLRKNKKGFDFAYGYLTRAAMRGTKRKWFLAGVHENGLIVSPGTSEGEAAWVALLLDKKDRIDRVKQCIVCRSWFYARFKHQRFCNDPVKQCQWKHYHTAEWRKQHRERNRKHQQEYRERLFGPRKGKTP